MKNFVLKISHFFNIVTDILKEKTSEISDIGEDRDVAVFSDLYFHFFNLVFYSASLWLHVTHRKSLFFSSAKIWWRIFTDLFMCLPFLCLLTHVLLRYCEFSHFFFSKSFNTLNSVNMCTWKYTLKYSFELVIFPGQIMEEKSREYVIKNHH